MLLKPIGLRALITVLPLLPPTFCTAHLLTDDGHGVPCEVTLKRLLTTPWLGGRRRGRFPVLMAPCPRVMGARCQGTTPCAGAGTPSYRGCLPGALRPLASMGWRLPLAWGPSSPTTCSPCGLQRPSPDALCVFRRRVEGPEEATPSLRRRAEQARKCHGPPPPAPRPKRDSAPPYRLRLLACCPLWEDPRL